MARRRLKTSTPREIRTTLTKVINMVYNGELDPKAGNTIVTACNSVLAAIRIDEQQKRIDELEKLTSNKDAGCIEWKTAIIEVAKRREEQHKSRKLSGNTR